MQKMLITGGTGFVSRYAAEYYAEKYDVYVLNRDTRPQSKGVTLIKGDRHALGDALKKHHFDVVFDATGFDREDIDDLLNALGTFEHYIFISSSAVYPETEASPFFETSKIGCNIYWGKYGTDKIDAEKTLQSKVPNAYILRPPYLYGPMNNVYRESFVFDCAIQGRIFCLPGDGKLKLQFLHIRDLLRMADTLLEMQPEERIYNVGNTSSISVRDWVQLCYEAAGKIPEFKNIGSEIEQRQYFPFYDYEYFLDVHRQCTLLSEMIPLDIGLKESYAWYRNNSEKISKKPYFQYIDEYL